MIPIAVDWNAVRAEYISTKISQRDLAKKYGVTYPSVRCKAESEGWVELRAKAERKAIARTTQRAASAASSNAETAARIKAKLLKKLEKELDALPDSIGTETRQSVVDKEKGRTKEATKVFKLRDLAAAYRDLTADMPTTDTSVNPLLQSLYDLERRSADG